MQLLEVALLVFAALAGVALVVGTVAAAVLVANGKLTLPNTNMRRLQRARVDVEVAKLAREQEEHRMALDAQIDLRLQRAAGHELPPADKEVHF